MNNSRGMMDIWVDKTLNDLAGRCAHCCSFCFVKELRQPAVRAKYSGRPRLHAKSMDQKLPQNKVIFVSDCCDLFAGAVPDDFIITLMARYRAEPSNWYHFRTKNPTFERGGEYPPNIVLGTSIETTYSTTMRDSGISHAPLPLFRVSDMVKLARLKRTHKGKLLTMVALEPLFSFDLAKMVNWIKEISPDFVTVGIDSKATPHPIGEPTAEEIEGLVWEVHKICDVILKPNLVRILGEEGFDRLSDYGRINNRVAFRENATYHLRTPGARLVEMNGYKYLDDLY